MNYRKLPKTDLEISEIGFGCMSLDLRASDNATLIREAVDSGINYFDTADLYDKGANEQLVGKALKPVRKDIILATKVGNEWLPDGSTWRWNATKEYILLAVDKSLKRLQTDYIDIYQLHGGTIEDNLDEVIEAFEQLQTAGKIRHYGISSIRPNVIKAYCAKSNIVSDMLQYSLLDRRPEEEVLDHLSLNQVGVMVRGALAKGLLANKPASDYMNYSAEQVAAIQSVLNDLANSDRSSGQVATRYVLNHPAVTSAIIGIRTKPQLQEALGICSARDLSGEEMNRLQSVLKPVVYATHR
jgi:aryl-alcohol dehydrogenase-like predicted oxidoreductase